MTDIDHQETTHQAAVRDLRHLIEGLELPYLMALQQMLNEHIAVRRVEALAEARDKVRKIAASLGMTVEQVLDWQPASDASAYYDRATGKTWSGRGRMPEWVKVDRNRYRVQ